MLKFQPKKINWIYGYRTFRAMKSQGAWEFANRYFAKLFIMLGVIVLIITLILLAIYSKDVQAIKNLENIIIPIQLFGIIGLTLISTEVALRKRYDKNGNPKNQ